MYQYHILEETCDVFPTYAMRHVPVLCDEVLNGLDIHLSDRVVDMTLGDAGHAERICSKLGETGVFIGIDQDEDVLARARERLTGYRPKVYIQKSNFRSLDKVLSACSLPSITKSVFDLGLRSGHLTDSGRGFTFLLDEPLHMTMARPQEDTLTAKEIVNTWQEESLFDIISGFGEEKFARKIAREIVRKREEKPLETTKDLVELIENIVPGWYKRKRIHPATKTFQALRIAVNDEVGALNEALEKAFTATDSGGRIAVISYHSIEDRIVKRYFKSLEAMGSATILTKKPVVPSLEEEKTNPKSRSAKLRIIEKQ